MKTNTASLTLILALASVGAYAKEHAHDSGTLLQMDSAECGTDQKSGKSLAGEIIGTDGAHQKTERVRPALQYLTGKYGHQHRKRPSHQAHDRK